MLPVVVYLDDIAVFGDDQDQVLEDTLEAVRRLTTAGFMINLTKSQLVESMAKVLGHQWSSGGFWEFGRDGRVGVRAGFWEFGMVFGSLEGFLGEREWEWEWGFLGGLGHFMRNHVRRFFLCP